MTDNPNDKKVPNIPPTFKTPDFLKQSRFGKPNFGAQNRVQTPNIKQIRVTQHKGGS